MMQQEGLDEAKRSFPFRRYLLEQHDIGMYEYMQQYLSAEDYTFYRAAGQLLPEKSAGLSSSLQNLLTR